MATKSMTMNQAAEYLGKKRCTLYRWHNAGHLVYHHVGFRTEYEAEDVIRVKHPTFNTEQLNEEIKSLP